MHSMVSLELFQVLGTVHLVPEVRKTTVAVAVAVAVGVVEGVAVAVDVGVAV